MVDPEFGTGCVKITPAHDLNDYEVGIRHNLEVINIMNSDGSISNKAPDKYVGMSREDARKEIVNNLKDLGIIKKFEGKLFNYNKKNLQTNEKTILKINDFFRL